jgi:lipopolysaccharide transport system permease protein
MQDFSASPREMVASFWRNRQLIKALIARSVIGRYKGSYFGVLWSFFNPLLMLVIYTFVFGIIFKNKWSEDSNSVTNFSLILFAGLIVFNFFAECIGSAPSVILNNKNFVKKVVFPLEVLPVILVGSAFFHLVVSLAVWVIFCIFTLGPPPATFIFLPIILLPLIFFTMGFSWLISSLGVYLKDTSQLIGLLIPGMMFLSPIFYPLDSVPNAYKIFILVNPITYEVEVIRDILIFGELPNLVSFSCYTIGSVLLSCIGFFWFQKTRRGFADVI